MFEATSLCAIALLLLAAASHRFRREAGVSRAREVGLLRVVAATLLTVALVRSGAPLPGERYVRFLTAASIAGAILILLLSSASAVLLQPLRWALTRVR